MNIIDRREKVPLGTHEPLRAAMKHLPPALALLAIPSVAGASVEAAQFVQEFKNIRSFHQCVIMVRKHAPGDGSCGALPKQVQQGVGESVLALRGESDIRRVLITGGGDEEMDVAVIGPMRRGMPWVGVALAPRENFLTLLSGQLPPDVMIRGHSSMESRL